MALPLRNPHSVLAAFEVRPQAVVEIRLAAGQPSGAWAEVAEVARRHGVSIAHESRPATHRRQKSRGGAQGRGGVSEAMVKEKPSVGLAELFDGRGRDAQSGGRLWLALDQIQDPHNVGAIFRTAAFFGVQGLVLSRDRSAPLSATVYDVSSGGMEYIPFSLQTNLARALKLAKETGLWVLGSSEHAQRDVAAVDRGRPWLLVLGNEEQGLRRLTQENCDELCRLTPHGRLTSLNVSVAAGILIASLTGPRS